MLPRAIVEMVDVILRHFLQMDFGEFEGASVGESRRHAESSVRSPTPRVPWMPTRLVPEPWSSIGDTATGAGLMRGISFLVSMGSYLDQGSAAFRYRPAEELARRCLTTINVDLYLD